VPTIGEAARLNTRNKIMYFSGDAERKEVDENGCMSNISKIDIYIYIYNLILIIFYVIKHIITDKNKIL
jgi:hypothetical protein